MKIRIAAVVLAAAALAAMPAAAMAAPKGGPNAGAADGTCVARGVTLFGGPTIAAVAQGAFAEDGVTLSFVIKDHAFNNAEATAAYLGIDPICD